MRHVLKVSVALAFVGIAACDSTEPLKPASMTAAAPLEQTAVVGSAVAQAPAVRITTSSGKPVPGIDVTFAAGAGSGSVAVTAVKTNADGVASAGAWTLGTTSGAQEVIATTAALPAARVSFRTNAAAGPPRRLTLLTQPPTAVVSGALVTPAPAVQLADEFDNAAPGAGVTVTAAVAGGNVTLTNASAVTNAQGSATFTGLVINGPAGVYHLQFTAPSLQSAAAAGTLTLVSAGNACTAPQPLALTLGQIQRYTTSSSATPACFSFDIARNSGQQYMLLFENMPVIGGYETGVFPGPIGDTTFQLTLRARPPTTAAASVAPVHAFFASVAQPDAAHAWDFGDGPIYELEPAMPAFGVPEPVLLREGQRMLLNSVAADPQVGDTIVVRMEGIPRLNISTGNYRAVIRFISNELIIAEDTRLTTTLVRQGGGFNTPLTPTDLTDIAREYAAMARVQGDIVFENRFNTTIEARTPARIMAVHSLMGSDNIWGYTYSTGDYFVWDYWVQTNGSTRGLSQHPQRVADNLFMHEIAHMRHWGMLQRNGSPPRGNKWLVEGFARFSERLPIAHRLLNTATPSRTANVELPRNPAFNNSYFRDDVPTFLNAGSALFGGYQNSSFIFDYFADQVAVGGGNWLQALRELVISAGAQATLDATVQRWLPGLTFAELFTRARIALYLDDNGTAGLPAWTQYHQYRLRDSRPAGSASASDPRNAWPPITPGTPADIMITVGNGGAYGVIIDGTQSAAANATFAIDAPATANGVFSIVRIR